MHQVTSHRERYRLFAKAASAIVALTGTIAILGWLGATPSLPALLPDFSATKFNSAVGLLLLGISLHVQATGSSRRMTLNCGRVAAAAALLLGLLTALEYAAEVDFGIDQLFAVDRNVPDGHYPGRMSFVSAINFMLCGCVLLLLTRNAAARWTEGLTFLTIFNALIPAIGYLYGKTALYQIPYFGTISLPVTLAFLLLCAGLLALRPDCGLMALVSNDSAGGITARRLLPAAILLPLAVNRLEYWGRDAGLYDATFGMIAVTLSSIAIFTLLIGWNARLLLRLDNKRSEAEDALHETLGALERNLDMLSNTNARLQAEISMRHAVEENLFHEHQRMQVTLNSIGDGVITTDIDGKVVYLNPAAEQMCRWTNADAVGQSLDAVARIVDPVSRHAAASTLEATLLGNKVMRRPSSSILIRHDGTEAAVDDSCAPMHDRDGRVVGAVLVFRDVSAMREMSLRMAYIAQHDALTDLPNRFLLNDRLAQAIGLAQRHGTRAALLFVDLDRFKHVNDTLGHATGDRLLQEIARRLRAGTRDTDTISRHSGDEFVILLQQVSDSIDAARAATQVLKSITEPYFIDEHDIHVSASIGISICPDDGADGTTVIKHAEAAMYQAKAQGRNNYQFFTRHINERALRRFALESSLRRAVAREESALHYQPKLCIASGRVIGAEALIRWNNLGSGPVPPAQFIPIAEETGLIIPIGEWVLRHACAQNRTWQDAGYAPIPIAVNVSAVQFRDKNFLEMVARALHETGLEPRYLELELTESVTMQDLELTVSLLEALKKMGVGLSIDDFGTGYSSLSYLKRFPIDTLKIDRSFVQDIATDPDDAAITCAIISMAKSLKQKVIAEGVETPEQFEFLRRQGCDEIQGYYFSEPLAAHDFERKVLQREAVATPLTPAPTTVRPL
ncbi:bifunctional diguanylate cyclase/phosphodiesterase [Noviherbaspirillum sp. UKPF54]|uniref:putative bifunctional diguanylate cyclase/phosphodiesterase n=1 Tax=Noviherbaspirillum sp. UKPF54 TaxID=2601898 RepID=UPI00143DCE20|nr:EAL domain-containing protein [Noviherbaspirillum sp. UKPF54]